MNSIKLEPVDFVGYSVEWPTAIKIEEIAMDELFTNGLPEQEHQNTLSKVEIMREAAGPDEIVKEEPKIYDEYNRIEAESKSFNENKIQINETIETRSITPTEAQSTEESQPQKQTLTEYHSKPHHSKEGSQAKRKKNAANVNATNVKTSNGLPGTKFKCSLCKAVLCSEGNLKRHQARFHGTKAFQCNICPKRFPLKYSLQLHQRLHTGLKPFKCKICLRLFANRNNLRRHNVTCRSLEGSQILSNWLIDQSGHFECYICKFGAVSKYVDLKTHMKEHTGRKQFRCNICRRMFVHQSNLVKHMHEHTMKKPYECDICANTFTCSRNLKRHKRLHTRKGLYKCNRCPKEYTTKFSRDVHEKKHKIS